MATKWKSVKGKKGVRYYEHATRLYNLRKDRYYAIRYTVDRKQIEEGIGWDTEIARPRKTAIGSAATEEEQNRAKHMAKNAEEEAERRLNELKENRRRGEGPVTLKEKRGLEAARRRKEKKEGLTFGELFEGLYTETIKPDKRPRTWARKEGFYEKYISTVLGNKPLKDIAPIDIERIKRTLKKKKRAPRTIQYCLGEIRNIFNFAIKKKLFDGTNPVSDVKIPSPDNRRLRFLTREEADALLAKLKETSVNVHDMALLSLHTGMRAGEIFGLTWGDADLDRGTLTLRDTKSGKTRAAFMTGAVKDMLMARKRGAHTDLVFPDRKGKRIEGVSRTFSRAVDDLKLNAGIKDRRYKVCFHTLRHTYASWHVEAGTDLYAVKELLGHSDFKMTARYSHLGENTLRAAVNRLDSVLKEQPQKVMEKEA